MRGSCPRRIASTSTSRIICQKENLGRLPPDCEEDFDINGQDYPRCRATVKIRIFTRNRQTGPLPQTVPLTGDFISLTTGEIRKENEFPNPNKTWQRFSLPNEIPPIQDSV